MVTARDIALSLSRTIERDLNPQARCKEAVLAARVPALLLDVADPSGPNGSRTFIIEIREVE